MTTASTDPDRDRLWRHAPILRFDARELFFPTSVEGFVEASTLWPAGRESDRDSGPPFIGAGLLFAANLSELHAVQPSRSRQNNNDQ